VSTSAMQSKLKISNNVTVNNQMLSPLYFTQSSLSWIHAFSALMLLIRREEGIEL